jgi:alkaline phosphatase
MLAPRLLALTAACLLLAACAQTPAPVLPSSAPVPRADVEQRTAPAQNLILLIGDGYGPVQATMARAAKGAPLALDRVQTGSVETSASDARVTDSAAGATAYASGIKSYNGAIGVDRDQQPVPTLLEAAERRGMATGLVATSRITHATPASFAAHVVTRSAEAEIAAQMLDQGIEVLLGGGARFFAGEGGSRLDGRDLFAEARAAGVQVATDRAGYDALADAPADRPILGVLAPDHLAYDLDRAGTDQPSLAEMTTLALERLRNAPDGFFLMVEGSRIDHAGHGNDAAGVMHDALAFDEAAAVALRFARENPGTLVVATADHETGGLTLGRDGIYDWKPEVLLAQTATMEVLAPQVAAGEDAEMVLKNAGALAMDDSLRADERALLAEVVGGNGPYGLRIGNVLGRVVAERARVGWTTSGHTAVDVPLFAFGAGADAFTGNLPNDEVGRRLAAALGLDLSALADEVREKYGSE